MHNVGTAVFLLNLPHAFADFLLGSLVDPEGGGDVYL
jgi:hypothetical protein